MSRLGAHVRQGQRNGFGPFCEAKPAVVLSVDDGGALGEAKTKSNGYTVTIFRQTDVYLEAPPDFNTYPDMVQLARYWYQQLRPKWDQNPADFVTITNEIGGNDPAVMRRLVEYEREVMRLANADGRKVAVLNLATGTPGDFEQWQSIYAPLIVEAWAGKNLYARHAYGDGDLVDASGNVIAGGPSRPFAELGHLRSLGAAGGIALTEVGLDAGFNFAGIGRLVAQLGGYEKLLRVYPEFVGECGWTLGLWQGPGGEDANWQDALPAVTAYLTANPTPKWTWPTNVPPIVPPPAPPPAPPPTSPERVTIQSTAGEGNVRLEPTTEGKPIGAVPNGTQFEVVEDVPNWYGVKVWVSKIVAKLVEDTPPADPPAVFALASPVQGIPLFVTDWFNTPRSYAGDHEGLDLRATSAAGQPVPIVAAAAGIVDGIRATDPGTGYGIYVRLRHERPGVVWKTWFCHLSKVAPGLQVGKEVTAGQVLGTAGSSGNSTGVHLHLTVQKLPGGLPGFVIDSVVDPAPLLGLAPPSTPHSVDLLPYLRGDGRIYTVKHPPSEEHPNGAQEDVQVQTAGNAWLMVKNGNYESFYLHNDFIWRDIDISPGPAPKYDPRPGVHRYYTTKEPGQPGARWCKRYMAIGETYTGPGHHVQFFYKENCQPSPANSGPATNRVTLVARHASKTWEGFTVQDVIELKTNTGETMHFSKGFGLVAWGADWGMSHIVEVSPAGRPPLEREIIPCL